MLLGLQVVLFVNDTTISKGMVKYASNLTRESIIDVEGTISVPQEPIAGCSQSEVLVCVHLQIWHALPLLQVQSAGMWVLEITAFCPS